MTTRLPRLLVVALACVLPLLTGCAFGVGQFGPGGGPLTQRAPFGGMVGVGYSSLQHETLDGQRDTTWHNLPQIQGEIVCNLPGNLLSVGGSWVYTSTPTERPTGTVAGPERMRFKGNGYGPSAYLSLGPLGNVDVKAIRMNSRLENADVHDPTLANGGTVNMPATRYQADLNLVGLGILGGSNLQIGWQRTRSDRVTAFGATRAYASEGPHVILWRAFGPPR